MKKKRRKRNEYNIESHLKVEFSAYTEFILTFTYTLTLMLCIALFIGDIAWCKQIKNRV